MNKNVFLCILILGLLVLGMSISSAYTPIMYKPVSYSDYRTNYANDRYGYGSPKLIPSSSSNSFASYRESPGYTQFPKENFNQATSVKSSNSNFDSSSNGYDYRGPMYERKMTYLDDFSHDVSSKSGFFSGRSSDDIRHTISATFTEKYIGASESAFYNNQNRRIDSQEASQNTNSNYDSGFSFGKQRSFDSSEYNRDSYTTPYYYRPMYDSREGYYNWRY